jgi:hypothetical protein
MIACRPEASLREIAQAAGISPGTVRDVRDRMRRGDDPIPLNQRGISRRTGPDQRPAQDQRTGPDQRTGHDERTGPDQRPAAVPRRDPASILRNLRKDPSLRFSESGRALLRWLDMRAMGPDGSRQLIDTIPPHCTYIIADLARATAEDWLQFADRLKRRAEATV